MTHPSSLSHFITSFGTPIKITPALISIQAAMAQSLASPTANLTAGGLSRQPLRYAALGTDCAPLQQCLGHPSAVANSSTSFG